VHKRFERTGKFVEIAVAARTLITTTGRIGEPGTAKKQTFRSVGLARQQADVAEIAYRKKRWTSVSVDPPPCAPTASWPRDAVLEAAIRTDRDGSAHDSRTAARSAS
jgi:predicted DNA-binding WGR domain protein